VSLSDELRSELAAVVPRRRCCRLAELSGLLHAAGTAHLRGRGAVALHVDVGASAVARRAFSLLRELGVDAEVRTYRRRALGGAKRYQLHVAGTEGALAVLDEAGVMSRRGRPYERPPARVVGRGCCRAAYLRGALLGAGSLTAGASAHLEVRLATWEGATFVAEVAAREGANLSVRDRGPHAVAYAKGAEAIGDLLALTGAGDTRLALEERAVVAATRARANRLANADHANLVRASRAADAQLRAIERLRTGPAWQRLSQPLRDAAELRQRHPSLSLAELARRTPDGVTRPTLHRRLATLVRLAEAGGSATGATKRRAGGEAPRTTSPSG
jgi:hypothetical protein